MIDNIGMYGTAGFLMDFLNWTLVQSSLSDMSSSMQKIGAEVLVVEQFGPSRR